MDIPLKLIKLEDDNYHPVLESRQGGNKLYWIIDTGASKTVFDKNLTDLYIPVKVNPDEYQSVGIGDGMIETSLGKIPKIKFGKLKITDLKVALIDLSHINSIYKKFADITIAGLLGSDILYVYGCIISYRTHTISFRKRQKKAV